MSTVLCILALCGLVASLRVVVPLRVPYNNCTLTVANGNRRINTLFIKSETYTGQVWH